MLSSQLDQAERLEVFENDKRLRDASSGSQAHQGSTFLDHTHNDTGGRFSAVSNATVIGTEPFPRYPQLPASSPWAGPDLVGDEPPLSDNPAADDPSSEVALPREATPIAGRSQAALPLSARPAMGFFRRF
jgi:hypothetical protein